MVQVSEYTQNKVTARMPGYSGLARMIGKRFRELSIFRTFSSLHAQSLLYMQAELVQIEADMEAFVKLREMQPFDQCSVNVAEKEGSVDAAIWKFKNEELHEKLRLYCEPS